MKVTLLAFALSIGIVVAAPMPQGAGDLLNGAVSNVEGAADALLLGEGGSDSPKVPGVCIVYCLSYHPMPSAFFFFFFKSYCIQAV